MTTALFGPDVSSNNGSVNWAAVKGAGASFGITKLSEGTTYTNPTAGPNWHQIPAAGLVRGGYHFARPDQGNTPEAEAQHFLSVLGGDVQPGDLLALDIEVGTGDLSAWCVAWLQTVEKAVGFKPFVYSGAWFAGGRLTAPALAAYPLWASAYPAGLTRAELALDPHVCAAFGPWSHVVMWQYSETATYGGIAGQVDDSVFLGTVEQLRALGKPGTTPVITTKPPLPVVLPATGKYRVLTDHWLRLTPRLDAPHVVLVVENEVIDAATPAGGMPATTTHWQWTRESGGHHGYAYRANLEVAP